MIIYSDKLAHVQVIINCRYSVAQMCTLENIIAHYLGAPSILTGLRWKNKLQQDNLRDSSGNPARGQLFLYYTDIYSRYEINNMVMWMRGDKCNPGRWKRVKIPLLPNNVGKKSVNNAASRQGHDKMLKIIVVKVNKQTKFQTNIYFCNVK